MLAPLQGEAWPGEALMQQLALLAILFQGCALIWHGQGCHHVQELCDSRFKSVIMHQAVVFGWSLQDFSAPREIIWLNGAPGSGKVCCA